MNLSEGQLWLFIVLLALVTATIKGLGPALFGGREFPQWALRIIAALAPAMLAALVATAVFTDGSRFAVGAHTAGVGVAAVLLLLRTPLIAACVVAVVVTAGLRAIGIG